MIKNIANSLLPYFAGDKQFDEAISDACKLSFAEAVGKLSSLKLQRTNMGFLLKAIVLRLEEAREIIVLKKMFAKSA